MRSPKEPKRGGGPKPLKPPKFNPGASVARNQRKGGSLPKPPPSGSRRKKATPGYVRGIPAPVSTPGRKAAAGGGGTGHRKGIEAGGLSAEGRTEGLGNLGPPRTPKTVHRALHDQVAGQRPMYGGRRSSDTYTGS